MASFLLSLITPTVLIVLLVPGTCQDLEEPPASWKLALHWPNSFCGNTGVKCIRFVPQDAFVIRTLFGLSQFGSEMTCESDQPPPLDRSEIAQLVPTLSQYWPDLEGDNFGLWEKEWQRRAACYGINATEYFTNAIGLRLNINLLIGKGLGTWFPGDQVFGALSSQDVNPGKTYAFMTFQDVLSSKYDKRFEVLCNDDAAEENQLLEFLMCATAGYRYSLIDCPFLKTTECMKDTRYT